MNSPTLPRIWWAALSMVLGSRLMRDIRQELLAKLQQPPKVFPVHIERTGAYKLN